MRKGDRQFGFPFCDYRETKANIEALTGLVGGETAHATDTGENGYYDEIALAWVWSGAAISNYQMRIYQAQITKTAARKIFANQSFR